MHAKLSSLGRRIIALFVLTGLQPVAAQKGQSKEEPESSPKLESLAKRKVPEPSKLKEFVRDKTAAIALGKALFWDMKVGSDNLTSCASCHFHAGADNRIKNQISPGLLRVDDSGNSNPDYTFQLGGPNYTLRKQDFPIHKLLDPNNRKSTVVSSSNDIVSSQGVFLEDFGGLQPDGSEVRSVVPDEVFQVKGLNTRRVEPRNTPTVINAIFNLRNFWDGRAQESFNGVNPFGQRDAGAYVWKADKPKDLKRVAVDLDNASLASQAVGPPLSTFEMSSSNRLFQELGRKLLSQRPLAAQRVHPDDSVLGGLSRGAEPGLTTATYADLIRQAFKPEWWQGETALAADSTDPVGGAADTMGLSDLSGELKKKKSKGKAKADKKPAKVKPTLTEFTHMEANFSLYFGLAIQLYEATLVSDQTPFDRYAESKSKDSDALTSQQKLGLDLFFGKAKCANCHGEAEFTKATVHHIKKERLERMVMGNNKEAVYDNGFYNIGVTPTREDLGVGANDPFGFPLSESKLNRDHGEKTFKRVLVADPNIKVKSGERVAASGAFKTPTLRNIELTAPYFHNGGTRTLREVVDFYNRGGDFKEANLDDLDPDITNLGLSDSEKEALVAFMKALTDERVRYRKAPFDHPQLFIPNGHLGDENTVTNDGEERAKDLLTELPATGRDGGAPFKNFLE
jgi:cytochrome c peroxidase